MDKCSIVRLNQKYRGVADPIKFANLINQTVYSLNVADKALEEINDGLDTFSESYHDKGTDVKEISIIEDSVTKTLKFLPLSSSHAESFNSAIQDIESIIQYCNSKIGDLS